MNTPSSTWRQTPSAIQSQMYQQRHRHCRPLYKVGSMVAGSCCMCAEIQDAQNIETSVFTVHHHSSSWFPVNTTVNAIIPTPLTSSPLSHITGAPQQLRQALCTSAHDASGTLTLSQLLQVLATIPGTLAHHGLTWFRAHQREGRVGVDTVLELLNNTA